MKGQLTIPNLVGVFVLIFIFMVFLPVIRIFLADIFPSMGVLGQIPIALFIPMFLIVVLSAIWRGSEVKEGK